jgi:RND family efflux transporter MFP subunit
MTKKITTLGFIIIMIITFMIGCDVDATESETINKVVPITLEKVSKDVVEETYVTIGEVIPENQVDVYLNTLGEIETIFIRPGDYVEKDMPLIQLVNDNTNKTFNSTESQLRTIRDNLAVQYNAALENYNQQKTLFESGVSSQNAVNTSYDQLVLTQRQYQDARTNYNNQLSNLQSTVDDLLVKSPIDGQIASLNVRVGQNAGNQLAATVIDNSKLYVMTMVSSELKKTLSLEQDVRLYLESVEGPVNGQISLMNEIPDLKSKLFEVRIEIMDDVPVSVGDFSEVKFVKKSYEAILIPSTAIVRKGIEKYVFLYKDGDLTKVVLETGLSKGEWIEIITDGIMLGDSVVLRGQNNLREDDEVEVVE